MKKTVRRMICAVLCAATVSSVIFGAGVSALSGKAGDVNRDGSVDNKDVVALFRYLNGTSGTAADVIACDANGDGEKDNKDVVTLFRHLSDPGVKIYYNEVGIGVSSMRVNYEIEPSCVEDNPSFSWTVGTEKRGIKQMSYRISVADSVEALNTKDAAWDSGTVESDNTVNVVCDAKLKESTRYYWTVTVQTSDGSTVVSDVSHFDTALTETGFKGASWIIPDAGENAAAVDGAYWIWLLNGDSQGDVPEKAEYFRYRFSLSKDIETASLSYTADDYGVLYINGRKAAQTDPSRGWENAVTIDAKEYLNKGENVIACSSVNTQHGYGALILSLNVVYTDKTTQSVKTDGSWLATDAKASDWYKKDADESKFKTVDFSSVYGNDPWMSKVTYPDLYSSAPTLRYEFDVTKPVKSAHLFASAAGLYDAYVNGQKAGGDVLDPGRSEYTERIMYQSHDLTNKLKTGKNVIGAVLGRGWYIGAYSPYGAQTPAFICKLVIDYEDGERQIITTNKNWRCTVQGPILYNDIFNGETYDARLELDGWSDAGYDDGNWSAVKTSSLAKLGLGTLVPQLSGTIKIMDTVTAKEMTEPSKNVYIYDFGQNLAGFVTIKVKGKAGTTVKLRHAEMLNDGNNGSDGPKGTLYTQNLRTALATDTYTLKGDPSGEEYTPAFTFHGFRYLEITGLSAPLELSDVTANVLYSDMEDTGSVTTDDELVNKLISNTYWGQRSNFLSTPTDCPQRDERMGWSGDAQIFCGTAAYNMNVKAFFDKYITDLNDCQRGDGAYPDVAPQTYRMNYTGSGNNAWADAGVIIPWVMYTRYGDLSYIEKYYSNMKKYASYLLNTSDNYIRARSAYGDWLSIGESTSVAVTDTAYCVYVFDLLSKMASLLGNKSDSEYFKAGADNYRAAWLSNYVRSNGRIIAGTQTAYLLALAFEIVPEADRQACAERLNKKITDNGYKLTTGFIGCPLLLPVLCEYGYTETAFALLQQTEYPSWKYPILQGATTIWERWNSYTIASGFGDAAMNSFNHYSYGSVTEWIYSTLAGIGCDENAPGFSHIILKPTADKSINHVTGKYESIRGLIKSSWDAENGNIVKYNCTVPGNTTATLYLHANSADKITEGGKTLSEAEGVTLVSFKDGVAVIELTSGVYNFTIG